MSWFLYTCPATSSLPGNCLKFSTCYCFQFLKLHACYSLWSDWPSLSLFNSEMFLCIFWNLANHHPLTPVSRQNPSPPPHCIIIVSLTSILVLFTKYCNVYSLSLLLVHNLLKIESLSYLFSIPINIEQSDSYFISTKTGSNELHFNPFKTFKENIRIWIHSS